MDQKALSTFMGGLISEIAEGIGIFKPRLRMNNLLDLTSQIKTTKTITIKQFSWDKMQKKRAQGLCFNCNEKFTTCHKCRKPQLLLLERDLGVKEDSHMTNEPGISLHALTGWSTARAMRITPRICNQKSVVLIDNKSTHNFISEGITNGL